MNAPEKLRGFSLVELSIVLVIIGLLTGGILMGQSLIRNAEIQSVITDYQKYRDSALAFRDQYDVLPGDMPDATNYWGAQDTTPATCRTTASSSDLTCNGDGNGLIADATGSMEHFRFWQHLASAKIISGRFNGINVGGVSIASHTPGTNVPAMKMDNVGWSVYSDGSYSGDSVAFSLNYGTRISVGKYTANWWPHGRAFKPEEVWNIDTKLDDGKPGQGLVVAAYWNECTLAASQTDVNVEYDLSNSNEDCAIYFARAL
jgi:prepilin-type N-terminal cleavage/methylation domain-containing protein